RRRWLDPTSASSSTTAGRGYQDGQTEGRDASSASPHGVTPELREPAEQSTTGKGRRRSEQRRQERDTRPTINRYSRLVKLLNTVEAIVRNNKKRRDPGVRAAVLINPLQAVPSDGLRGSGRRRRSARERTRAGFLFTGLVDFDGAFKVGAVFDHDAGGGEIAVDGPILLYLDAILGAKISLDGAVDHDFASDNIRGQLGRGAHGKFALVKLHQTLDRSLDHEVFVSGNFALHVQAWPEPRRSAIRGCTNRTHCISTHGGSSLPRCRRRLRRRIHWQMFCFRLRGLRRIRLLITPHRTSQGTSTPHAEFWPGVCKQ